MQHTVEEAYELANAANARDDAKLLDELGDVLFQVHFLSLLLEERGAGDLAAADGSAWQDLGPEDQLAYYARARLNEETP